MKTGRFSFCFFIIPPNVFPPQPSHLSISVAFQKLPYINWYGLCLSHCINEISMWTISLYSWFCRTFGLLEQRKRGQGWGKMNTMTDIISHNKVLQAPGTVCIKMPHKFTHIFLHNMKINIFMYFTEKRNMITSWLSVRKLFYFFFLSTGKQTCSSEASNMNVARNCIRKIIPIFTFGNVRKRTFYVIFSHLHLAKTLSSSTDLRFSLSPDHAQILFQWGMC